MVLNSGIAPCACIPTIAVAMRIRVKNVFFIILYLYELIISEKVASIVMCPKLQIFCKFGRNLYTYYMQISDFV